jgi:hypothetical protein
MSPCDARIAFVSAADFFGLRRLVSLSSTGDTAVLVEHKQADWLAGAVCLDFRYDDLLVMLSV